MGGVYKEMRRRFKEYRKVCEGYREWQRLQSKAIAAPSSRAPCRLLIVPADPWNVTGSRGDEAMIMLLVRYFASTYPEAHIAIITADEKGSSAVRSLGLTPLQAWCGPHVLRGICEAAAHFDPDWAVIIGADVMDGYYSAAFTLTLVATADLLARRGCRTAILGFSFNRAPRQSLKRAFARISPQVVINVRDPVSLERFARFTPTKARLVADAAFMLSPETNFPEYQTTLDWVKQQHQAGRTVLGVNVHPMLIKNARDAEVLRLATGVAGTLARLGMTRPVSFMLLPHDFRAGFADNRCLDPMAKQLCALFSDRIRHLGSARTAAELKALAGLADGVVSSRLHLAIATLGMGKPALVFNYQDKFPGLLRHFGLSDWLVMPAPDDSNAAELLARLGRFVNELCALRSRVVEKLPVVLALSRLNLDI